MAPIYLGKRVVPSSLRYIENLAKCLHTCYQFSIIYIIRKIKIQLKAFWHQSLRHTSKEELVSLLELPKFVEDLHQLSPNFLYCHFVK